jgi:hypothetical protein
MPDLLRHCLRDGESALQWCFALYLLLVPCLRFTYQGDNIEAFIASGLVTPPSIPDFAPTRSIRLTSLFPGINRSEVVSNVMLIEQLQTVNRALNHT